MLIGPSLSKNKKSQKTEQSRYSIWHFCKQNKLKILLKVDEDWIALPKKILGNVLTICVLTAVISINQLANAGYQPPKDQKPPSGYSDSSGVRGSCHANSDRPPKLLAPTTHVGLTTSTHPTFAWFVLDKQPVVTEFSIYEFDTNLKPKKLDSYTQRFLSEQGLMQQSLSKELPGLRVGKRYLWQLQSLCSPNYPSRNLIARAEIEVVSVPQTLALKLASANDSSHRANLYGKYGIWYDALKEVLPSTSREGLNQAFIALLASLGNSHKAGEENNMSNIHIAFVGRK